MATHCTHLNEVLTNRMNTCPNEVSAAEVTKHLMNSGFNRVRPLHVGLDA